MAREKQYVVRAPKGRAGRFLTGTSTHKGEWGPRASAMRGGIEWASQYARIYGGTVDSAGWREVSLSPVAGFVSPRLEAIARRDELSRGAAERAARKDGTFFGTY